MLSVDDCAAKNSEDLSVATYCRLLAADQEKVRTNRSRTRITAIIPTEKLANANPRAAEAAGGGDRISARPNRIQVWTASPAGKRRQYALVVLSVVIVKIITFQQKINTCRTMVIFIADTE